jgi:hypothetical protein
MPTAAARDTRDCVRQRATMESELVVSRGPSPNKAAAMTTPTHGLRRLAAASLLAAAAITAACLMPATGQGSTWAVTQATWGTTSSVGSFAWAIDQANNSATNDVISVGPNLQISVDGATGYTSIFNLATITRSVTILGHNATLVGNPVFETTGGQVVTKNNPQEYQPGAGDILLEPSYSFAKIGISGTDNSGLRVTIQDLNTDGLNRFARVERNASLDYSNSGIAKSVNFTGNAAITPGFDVTTGGTLTADRLTVTSASALNGGGVTGFFSGLDATLNISRANISDSNTGGAVVLAGGTANVVSSIFYGSGGVTAVAGVAVPTATMNVVNTAAYLAGPLNGGDDKAFVSNKFSAGPGAVINLQASTVIADLVSLTTGTADATGAPLNADGGSINLMSSAVMATTDEDSLPGQIAYSASNGGTFSADAYSWVRPTPAQSGTALQVLFGQPGLLTGSAGLGVVVLSPSPLIEMALPYPEGTYPVNGGVLIGVVPDANGVNRLINPIDGTTILTDVFGDPRTTGGLRNVGAVELRSVPEPTTITLAVAATLIGLQLRRRRGGEAK